MQIIREHFKPGFPKEGRSIAYIWSILVNQGNNYKELKRRYFKPLNVHIYFLDFLAYQILFPEVILKLGFKSVLYHETKISKGAFF